MENQEAFCGDSSESHEHRTESIAVVMSSNPVTANAPNTHKVNLFSLLLLFRIIEKGLSNDFYIFSLITRVRDRSIELFSEKNRC